MCVYVFCLFFFSCRSKPAPKTESKPTEFHDAKSSPQTTPIESDPESDMDIDMDGCVEPDTDEPQSMGDLNKTPTEDEQDQASEIRSKAAAAFSEQNFDEAIKLYTEAITLNPTNALFYAKRGQTYLKLSKPNACIRDCDRALECNCDSAAAYKYRGRAHRLLGHWEEAAKDLRQACKIDFDEEADEWLREVTPNAKKLDQHRIKYERKRAEKELRERQERIRKAQEANKKAAEEQANKRAAGGGGGGADPDADDGPAGDFGSAFSQADILNAFKDPEVAAAFQDILANPANVVKYQNNPKIMNIVGKIGSAMGGQGGAGGGGMGGFPGMFGGGAGGFPGGAGGFPGGAFPNFGGAPASTGGAPPKPPSSDFHDDGLD